MASNTAGKGVPVQDISAENSAGDTVEHNTADIDTSPPTPSPSQETKDLDIQRREQRVQDLRWKIDSFYDEIPKRLRESPDVQEKCLELLWNAEEALVTGKIVASQLFVTRIEIEFFRASASKVSFFVVVAIVYLFVSAAIAAVSFNLIDFGAAAEELNKHLVMGIPLPVWLWALIGSLTSMLIRAGNFPFRNRTEALQWLVFRPIVGVVMGLLTYLLLTAGLIVFAGSSTPQTPELLWVIAFVGGFSDTLSVNLLKKLIGRIGYEDDVRHRSSESEPKRSGSVRPANFLTS